MNPLDVRARSNPEALALVADERQWSWSALHAEVRRRAQWLTGVQKLRAGDIVATRLPNTADHVLLLHAIWYCGAVAAPLHTRLTHEELQVRVGHLHPDLVLTRGRVFAQDVPLHAPVVDLSAEPDFPSTDSLPHTASGEDDGPAGKEEGGLCSVLYTSGSSGSPRAVAHGWAQHRASAAASAANLPLGPRDAWQCVIPLYHIGGLAILTRSLFSGCAVRLHEGFSSAAVRDALLRGDVTVTSLVPTMLHRLFEDDDALRGARLPQLRAVLLGGAGAPSGLWEEVRTRALPVVGTYGLTESCAQVATADPRRWSEETETAGRPLPGVELEIRSDAGEVCAAEVQGEIWLRGAMLVSEYYRNAAATEAAFRDGWFRTGDIGVIDTEGRLRVHARREDLILSGGENVLPAEVEDVLLQHDAVSEAAVVGVADAEWGQRVAAAVVVTRGDLQAAELEAFCRTRLAGYKLPRRWLLLDALPRTASGKIMRGKLREMFSEQAI